MICRHRPATQSTHRPLRVVHPIPRAKVDFKFADSPGENPILTRVAVGHAIHPHLHASAGSAVFESVDPIPIYPGHFDAHRPTVSHGIQISRSNGLEAEAVVV